MISCLTAQEAGRPLPGSRSMLPRLTELMVVGVLRKRMQNLSADKVGWLAAFNLEAAVERPPGCVPWWP